MPDESELLLTTASQGRPTTGSLPGKGNSRWHLQRRKARTLLVQEFLIRHGSKRLCTGEITYHSRVEFHCSKCGTVCRAMWKDLTNRDRVWCKSCAITARMTGVKPSAKMLAAAARQNVEEAAKARARRVVLPLQASQPLTRETTRSQARRLSVSWSPSDWKTALTTATRVFQRCTNPRISSYPYYGGRGIEVWFASPALMADWLLKNLGPRPLRQSLDRIMTNGHYEPGNLRWATKEVQVKNRNSWKHGT